MSKRQKFWHVMSVGGGHAATPMSTLALGTAFVWLWSPAIVTAYDEGMVQFLGWGYLGLFSLFTTIGAIGHWKGCDCEI